MIQTKNQMENKPITNEDIPISEAHSEDGENKLTYFGGDYLHISDGENTIKIHLGNVEWLQLAINNL